MATNFWGGFQPIPNQNAAQQVAPAFKTPVQPGAGHMGSGPVSTTRSPGTLSPTGQAIIPPGPNQTMLPGTLGAMTNDATPTGQAPSGLPPTDRGALIANSPAYQFRFDQGQQAIERGAAAKGTLLNGGTLKELTNFGQGLASTEYDNEFRRLADITRLGQTGAGQLGNYGSGYAGANQDLAGQQGQNDIGLGNAQGAGTIAGANATNQAGSMVANAAGEIDWGRLFNRQQKPNLNGFVQPGPAQFPGRNVQLNPPPVMYGQQG